MPRIGNGPVGIWADEASNVTIQYCISHPINTAKGAKDGGGFDFDGGITNSIIQYCLSYENQGAGYGLFQYAGASPWHNNVSGIALASMMLPILKVREEFLFGMAQKIARSSRTVSSITMLSMQPMPRL